MEDTTAPVQSVDQLRAVADRNRSLRPALIRAMGLTYDPFLEPVSEKDQAPNFLEIFVDQSPSLLSILQRRRSTLLFAPPGMGKTATRLALEYLLRNTPGQPPLCVTYRPHVAETAGRTREELVAHHYEQMAAAAAVDIVVQMVERYDDQPRELDQQQRAALQRQVRACTPVFQRLIRSAVAELEQSAAPPADGAVWRFQPLRDRPRSVERHEERPAIRPTVRYVAPSPRWQQLLNWMAAVSTARVKPQSWEQTVADARTLGFAPIFVLIDAIDATRVEPAAQQELLQPLLADVPALAEESIYLKCFAPPWSSANTAVDVPDLTLTGNIELATIDPATHEMLKALVRERLQAAGTSRSSIVSLDAFRREDIAESIEDRLARLADGSPRRMMELARDFLDFHSRHGFTHAAERGRPWMARAEWQEFLATIAPRQPSGSP